jgi:ABC-type cobalt transport system substrate-binding protein
MTLQPMKTEHLLTFVTIAILAGTVIFTTTSGMFAQADNKADEEEDEIAELQGNDGGR